MCYLIAKDAEKHLAEFKRSLNREVGGKGIQLVTISRPTAYGEHAPDAFAKDEQEFSVLVRAMRH